MRTAGGITRDYADMSSENAGEKPAHRKPKVSSVKVICGGLVDPKARPKGVVDGKQVNIPVPSMTAMGRRRRLGQPGVGCPGLSV